MYEERILAFIDVLGFSESIKNTIINGQEVIEETKKIDNLLNNIQWHLNYNKENFDQMLQNSKITSHFSDSIIISYLMTEESGIFQILLDILYICTTALHDNFLLRGSIVCDKIYHKENKIFGPALVKAYEIENKMAIYPRIVLDDGIVEIAKKYYSINHDAEMEVDFIKKLVSLDFDGLHYINYFDAIESELDGGIEEMPSYLENLRSVIKKMEAVQNISVRAKYLWIKEKYNNTIKKYKNNYDNDRAKNEFPKLFDYYKNITLL